MRTMPFRNTAMFCGRLLIFLDVISVSMTFVGLLRMAYLSGDSSSVLKHPLLTNADSMSMTCPVHCE